jgi:4-amino-4-deoxy-L-arabinose transferase-like glycosyltransferase
LASSYTDRLPTTLAAPEQQIAGRRRWTELVVVVVLTGLALAVRLYHLPTAPVGLHSDEAANGVDILNILSGQHPIFFTANTGREPLFIYLQALVVALLGATPFALRLTSALLGTATVPAVYWMVREAWHDTAEMRRWAAFWTALFLALSYWHINFSRIGLRAIMLPLMAALAFAWFWRAWRHLAGGDRFPWLDLILCGLFVGGSLYTYTAARFVPVLLVCVAAAGALGPGRSSAHTRRIAIGVGVIAATALIVFLPLGLYFISHPGDFFGRVASITVWQSSSGKHGGSLAALAGNIVKTAGMFGLAVDSNWRHNPAARPAIDLIMSIWLALGIGLAIVRWRSLPYLFALIWLVVLALPAALSEEAPNYLRALGILPAVCLLPVLAMLFAGEWLVSRRPRSALRSRALAMWLPLPFLILSGYTGTRDYFSAFNNPNTTSYLRQAFDARFVDVAPVIAEHDRTEGVWITPVRPIFQLPDRMDYNFVTGFLTRLRGDLRIVAGDKDLTEQVKGYRRAYLLTWHDTALEPGGAYAYADPKGLFSFLLNKYGRQVATRDAGDVSYATFDLPTTPDFHVASNQTPVNSAFGGKIKLTAIDYGHTATSLDKPAANLETKQVPSGHQVWVWMRWQAQERLDNRLKASISLRDASGHVASQIDVPILSDTYLWSDKWEAGQPATTYHILPILPGVPPGRYSLHVAVYDPETMQRLPASRNNGGDGATDVLQGEIEITRPITVPEVSPQHFLSDAFSGSQVQLLGYDLPTQVSSPGVSLPVTLYWLAKVKPSTAYSATVALRDGIGRLLVEQTASLGGDAYPTTAWSSRDVIRQWYDLTIPSATPAGNYQLEVSLSPNDGSAKSVSLGVLQVNAHAHNFSAPAVTHPNVSQVGSEFMFMGYDLQRESVQAGQPISITLHWRALAPSERSYTVFVHLLGADGQVRAQRDNIPGDGARPTMGWLAGEYVADSYELVPGKDLAAGRYALELGMYDALTGARLPVTDTHGRSFGDHILFPDAVEITAAR